MDESGISAPHFMEEALAQLQEAGLLRSMRLVEGAQGARIRIDGRDCINLAGNNPLGLANDPRVVQAAREALSRHGVGAGASRLICGNLAPHRELEKTVARFKGTEDAVVFPTGYMTNLGAISALAGRGDAVFIDKLSHASIIDGARLSGARLRTYPHGDAQRLRNLLDDSEHERRLVVTDSLFSMDGDLAPLADLEEICREHRAMLMVDEAHSTGVLGPGGRGGLAEAGIEECVLVKMGTLSKAIGCMGGFIAGPATLIAFLRNRARAFIFTTGLAPSLAAAARRAIELLEAEPERAEAARRNARTLYDALTGMGYACHPPGRPDAPPAAHILPVIIGETDAAMALAGHLFERSILAPAIRPPTVPRGTARIRLSAMCSHTPEEIEQVIEAFGSFSPPSLSHS
jgi:8-amino-7-oxononanoate synthase